MEKNPLFETEVKERDARINWFVAGLVGTWLLALYLGWIGEEGHALTLWDKFDSIPMLIYLVGMFAIACFTAPIAFLIARFVKDHARRIAIELGFISLGIITAISLPVILLMLFRHH